MTMTEELSSNRVERDTVQADLNFMAALVQRMIGDVRKSLSNVSKEVQETYEDTDKAVNLIIQYDFVAGGKKMKPYFHA